MDVGDGDVGLDHDDYADGEVAWCGGRNGWLAGVLRWAIAQLSGATVRCDWLHMKALRSYIASRNVAAVCNGAPQTIRTHARAVLDRSCL